MDTQRQNPFHVNIFKLQYLTTRSPDPLTQERSTLGTTRTRLKELYYHHPENYYDHLEDHLDQRSAQSVITQSSDKEQRYLARAYPSCEPLHSQTWETLRVPAEETCEDAPLKRPTYCKRNLKPISSHARRYHASHLLTYQLLWTHPRAAVLPLHCTLRHRQYEALANHVK